MSTRTNTANSGTTYVDMDIQLVGDDNNGQTLRAVIYLTSRNVSDSTNNCSVTGQWGRSGALGLGGVYSGTPVWSSDIYWAKQVGTPQTIGWNLSWSAVDYWGTTLSGTVLWTVPGSYGVPSAPRGYSARNITTSQAYTTGITVDNVAGGAWNNLRAQWSTVSSFATLTGDRSMGAWTDVLMDGLSPGVTYYFRVMAANTYYWSAWGATASFKAAASVPGKPAAPTVSSITSSTASVALAVPADNGSTLRGGKVQVANDSGFTSLVANVTVASSPYAVTGLTRTTQYWTRTLHYNDLGDGPWSPTTTFATLAAVPAAPVAPTVSGITTTTATVTVPQPDNGGSALTGWSIQYATNAAFTTGLVTQANGALTGLTPSTNYWTRAAAINAIGQGPTGPSTPFTSGATVPSAVAAPTVNLVTDSSAQVTWTAPNANGAVITNYNLQISKNSGFTSLFWDGQLDNVLTTQLDLLNPTTPYWVRLAAVNAQGTGVWGAATTFTTLSGLFYNDHGTDKRAELWLNVSGTWKLCELWQNVAGVWRKIS